MVSQRSVELQAVHVSGQLAVEHAYANTAIVPEAPASVSGLDAADADR